MARRRSTRSEQRERDATVERERRERLRRERERQRSTSTAPKRARPARRGAAKKAAAAAPVAVRERHEGLVGFVARNVLAAPSALGGFVREVGSIFAGIGRAMVRVVPGGSTLLDRRRGGGGGSSRSAPVAGLDRIESTVAGARRRLGGGRAAAPRTAGQLRAAAERRQRLRGQLRIAAVVVLAGAVVAAWIVVPASDAFRIRHVEVTGARAVDDLQVRERVDALLEGKTVFTVDEDEVARRIEQLPFVRSARVERHLPGGLQLHLSEYRPLALAYGDGNYWLVARDGRVLSKTKGEAWRGRIPTVQLQGRDIEPGSRLGDEPALQLLRALPNGSMLEFDVVRTEEYLLEGELTSGVLVRFGRPELLQLKVAAAQRTLQLAERNGEKLLYVDVSVPGIPARCPVSDVRCHQERTPADDTQAQAAAPGGSTTPEESGGDEADVSEVGAQ